MSFCRLARLIHTRTCVLTHVHMHAHARARTHVHSHNIPGILYNIHIVYNYIHYYVSYVAHGHIHVYTLFIHRAIITADTR